MTKQSKKAAAATGALALLRPGSGDRADVALRSFSRGVAPLLRPGAGDLRADARAARRFLVELGFLDARAADEIADEDENEAYERLVREAETSRVENDTTTDTLSLLRRVGRARRDAPRASGDARRGDGSCCAGAHTFRNDAFF